MSRGRFYPSFFSLLEFFEDWVVYNLTLVGRERDYGSMYTPADLGPTSGDRIMGLVVG